MSGQVFASNWSSEESKVCEGEQQCQVDMKQGDTIVWYSKADSAQLFRWTRDPTRDPRPATRDLRPATCDPRPATRDPRPATRDP